MIFVLQFVYSFFATMGFAIYFGAPINSIVHSGISGGASWALYYFLFLILNDKILANFMGALLVGTLGEFLAIKYKKPATVFITPGIVPLVPGAGMYYTMSFLVNKKYNKALQSGTEVFFMAAAIAVGIIVSTIFSKSLRKFRKKV